MYDLIFFLGKIGFQMKHIAERFFRAHMFEITERERVFCIFKQKSEFNRVMRNRTVSAGAVLVNLNFQLFSIVYYCDVSKA